MDQVRPIEVGGVRIGCTNLVRAELHVLTWWLLELPGGFPPDSKTRSSATSTFMYHSTPTSC